MNPNLQRILEKIAKLKAKAESAKEIGSQHEAEAFAAAVQRLLIEHELSMDDVEYHKNRDQDPFGKNFVDWRTYGMKFKAKRSAWNEMLAMTVANSHGCSIWVHPRSNIITLIGRESNRTCAEFVFVTLVRAADDLATLEYNKYYSECQKMGFPQRAKGYRNSFLIAFVNRIFQRYKEEERKAKKAGESKALVRVDNALVEANRWADENGKKVGAVYGSEAENAAGWARGEELANKIRLRSNAVEKTSADVSSLPS